MPANGVIGARPQPTAQLAGGLLLLFAADPLVCRARPSRPDAQRRWHAEINRARQPSASKRSACWSRVGTGGAGAARLRGRRPRCDVGGLARDLTLPVRRAELMRDPPWPSISGTWAPSSRCTRSDSPTRPVTAASRFGALNLHPGQLPEAAPVPSARRSSDRRSCRSSHGRDHASEPDENDQHSPRSATPIAAGCRRSRGSGRGVV